MISLKILEIDSKKDLSTSALMEHIKKGNVKEHFYFRLGSTQCMGTSDVLTHKTALD